MRMEQSSIECLEALYGPELDRLPRGEQEELARAALGGNEFLLIYFRRRGPGAPLLRPRLLRELARRQGGNMSPVELRLLQALRAMGPVANAALARAVRLPRETVYSHVYRLRMTGLAEKTAAGYDVTPEGRRIADASWRSQERQQMLFGGT